MIHYYAYYNHGGYKDLYLGCQEEEVEFKYFLPLLSVHEQSLIDNPDEELRQNVDRQKQLPKLIVLSDETEEYNYPGEARILMSHSGYKILYKRLSNSCSILSIRDISGTLDSYGRQTPFNLMLVGKDKEDRKSLDIIAEYTRCNIDSIENELKSFFENDFVENGLKFKLRLLNEYIKGIIESGKTLSVDEALNKPVRLLVIPNGMTMQNALREQNLSRYEVSVCYQVDGNLLYKAENHQQQANANSDRQNHGRPSPQLSPKGQTDHNNPSSLHAMLNVPKREDIEKLWEYIYSLEKRIEQLENNK